MPTPLVSCEELFERLRDPLLRLFDVRWYLDPARKGRDAYARAHLPDAQFAELESDLCSPRTSRSGRHPWPSVEQMVRFCDARGVSNSSWVVCYDDAGGAIAARMWMVLRWLGHKNVSVLDGGIARWQQLGFPLTAAPPTRRPRARYVSYVQPWLLAEIGELRGTLLDARAGERYRGKVEPVDPKAGHIPGARNRPFSMNLGKDGKLKKPADLARELAGTRNVIHYCGSGVTACHNLLAMEVAGLAGSRLYPGSWSEWSRREGLPVATGE